MDKAICKECGQPFEQQDRHQIYCDACEEEMAEAEDQENEIDFDKD